MANQEHLDIFKQGVETWNQWREEHPEVMPDLSALFLPEADLSSANLRKTILNKTDLDRAHLSDANLSGAELIGAYLGEADLTGANLSGANLTGANLTEADLSGANLTGANLTGAELIKTVLIGADLSEANLSNTFLNAANLGGAKLFKAFLVDAVLDEARLDYADLTEANLSGAHLTRASLIETNLTNATLIYCRIYGISAWKVEMEGAIQENLVITDDDEPVITIDNLKVAQFIYLLLNNAEIREVIDTITSKVVLILGRFTPERKAILDILREELRKRNYSPVLFDFEKPASRDLTGTISTLANLARFIIVDLTDPSSAPHEVATVIPQTIVPVQPLLSREPIVIDGKEVERRAYSMFKDLQRRYHWVLPIHRYTDQAHLLATLQEHVIAPAEQKAQKLAKR